ncbi:hypothetical protein HDU93_006946 [Gonapodya sp. JEL0774]|nr:hypothetical protein HDU93_006946 [Gonapodya sp. JEL0774]
MTGSPSFSAAVQEDEEGSTRGAELPEGSEVSKALAPLESTGISGIHSGQYATFLLLGLAMLLPWNVWITATDFFEKRFAGTHLANTFESWFGVVSMCINLVTVFVSFALPKKVSASVRLSITTNTQIIVSLSVISILFFIFSLATLTPWTGPTFVAFSLSCIFVSSIGTAFLQAGVFSIAAGYPSVMAQGIMNGQGVAGAVPAIVQVWIAVGKAKKDVGRDHEGTYSSSTKPELVNAMAPISATVDGVAPSSATFDPIFGYFLLASILTSSALYLYCRVLCGYSFQDSLAYISNLITQRDFRPFVSVYTALPSTPGNTDRNATPVEEDDDYDTETAPVPGSPARASLLRTLRSVAFPFVSVILVFAVTLAVFPAITAYVRSEADSGVWASVFVPVGFLAFCMGDWLGRFLPLIPSLRIRHSHQTRLLFFSVLRIMFVPFFAFCNVQLSDRLRAPLPRAFPVEIHSDAVFMLGVFLLGVTNGWAGSVCVMSGAEVKSNGDGEAAKVEAEWRGRIMVVGLTGDQLPRCAPNVILLPLMQFQD